jgi:hypothetical protein
MKKQFQLLNQHNFGYEPVTVETLLTQCQCGIGWHPLIRELLERLCDSQWDGRIDQIKEKFGCLRFYIPEANDQQIEIIDEYEQRSRDHCEFCGAGPARLASGRRWIKTLCADCERIDREKNPDGYHSDS